MLGGIDAIDDEQSGEPTGGGQMGKLAQRKLVDTRYKRSSFDGKMWPVGWELTLKGRTVLDNSEGGT